MNPFATTGRIGRLHYFLHSILDSLFLILVLLAPAWLSPTDEYGGVVISDTTIILMLVLFLVIIGSEICASIRRLHDLDRSGWQVLLLAVPVFNITLGATLVFTKGTEGPNKYGEDPLGWHEMPLDYTPAVPQFNTPGA